MTALLAEDFVVRGLLAGIAAAVGCGALGCFVVWRRMAYFCDSLAHATLAGIPLGIALGLGESYGIFIVAVVFAAVFMRLYADGRIAEDTALGIIAHSLLAVGVVAVSLADMTVVGLHHVLFGDILTVTPGDIAGIVLCSVFTLAVLVIRWDSLVLLTISEDMAKAEGSNTGALGFMLMLLMALVIAVSFKVVGVLLITSMLIIPAAAARTVSRSPAMMAAVSCLLGAASVVLGIYCSWRLDTPSGPSIVTVSAGLFVLLFAVTALKRKNFSQED